MEKLPDRYDEFVHFIYGPEATITACGKDWYITLTATTAKAKVTCPRCLKVIEPVKAAA